MANQVLSIVERTPASLDNESVRGWMHAFADNIGACPSSVKNVVLLLEGEDGTLSMYTTGTPSTNAHKVGLLSMAATLRATGDMDDMLGLRN